MLPNLPSALLRLALDDLAKLEANPNYVVNMAVWLGNCQACMAGAVMLNSLGVTEPMMPADFDEYDTKQKLRAINSFRMGDISDALFQLSIPLPEGLPRRVAITDYDDDPATFRTDLLSLATLLESRNS